MSDTPLHVLESEQIQDVIVVRFRIKSIRADDDILEIFGQLDQVVLDGCHKLVLSFAGIESIASYAIGRLMTLYQKMNERSGKLVICELTPIVLEIINLMKLNRKLTICTTEQDALRQIGV